MMSERPCDCLRCASVRLAWRIFVAFVAVLMVLGFLHRNDGRGRLLIDPSSDVSAAQPLQPARAAFVDQCGKVHRDLLDPRLGEPMYPIKRRGFEA